MWRTMDLGRLAIMPIFVWMLILNTSNLVAHAAERSPVATAGTVAALAFYLVLAVQYLRRGLASRTDRRPVVWCVSLTATFLPFVIPLVSPTGSLLAIDANVGSVLVFLGLAGSLWAAVSLGRNISVVPQARSVATHGPYRHFRHPLYAFELVAAAGLVILSGGGWGWVVLAVIAVLQVLRARWEEELLVDAVPGYREYRESTPGLVPTFARSSRS